MTRGTCRLALQVCYRNSIDRRLQDLLKVLYIFQRIWVSWAQLYNLKPMMLLHRREMLLLFSPGMHPFFIITWTHRKMNTLFTYIFSKKKVTENIWKHFKSLLITPQTVRVCYIYCINFLQSVCTRACCSFCLFLFSLLIKLLHRAGRGKYSWPKWCAIRP
jgi:hypothetical protein